MKSISRLAVLAACAFIVPSAFAYTYAPNFDTFATGAVNEQGVVGTASSGGDLPSILADPTGSGRGQVLSLSTPVPRDPATGGGNFRRESIATFNFSNLAAAGFTNASVSFDLYVVANEFQNLYFNSGANADFSRTVNDGRYIRVFNGGNRTNNGTFPTNAWVNVRMEWNISTGLANSFVNGVQLDTNFASTIPNPFTQFNIRTVTDNRPNGPESQWYVDNFNATAVPEPGTIAAVSLGVAALIRRRRSA